jgi:hypothetical protein
MSDQSVGRIHLHVAVAGNIGFILGALDLAAAQAIGLVQAAIPSRRSRTKPKCPPLGAPGARTPLYRTRLNRGGCTSAASFSTSSRGAKMTWVVPWRQRRFKRYSRRPSGNRKRRPVATGGRPASRARRSSLLFPAMAARLWYK